MAIPSRSSSSSNSGSDSSKRIQPKARRRRRSLLATTSSQNPRKRVGRLRSPHTKHTVEDITLADYMASYVAVVGANDAEKSTAIKLFIGAIKPEQGMCGA